MEQQKMNPLTVDEVIADFKGRRAAIVKALTQDVDKVYELCDPNSSNHLCLYGSPDQLWDVNLPPNSELLHPRLGINVLRDSMNKDDWLSMVALQSEAWLHAVASYLAAKFDFNTQDRKRLFDIIMDFPSIKSVLTGKTTERARKRKRVIRTSLPEELLILILARLPVRDLLRYRSVSKNFRSLIDDPKFVNTHLETYKDNSEESLMLFTKHPEFGSRGKGQVRLRCSHSFRQVLKLNYPKLKREKSGGFRELSYVNGLMLLCRKIRCALPPKLFLWNPSINKSMQVPCSAFQDLKDAYFRFGLGYDASQNDYKVVAVVYPKVNRGIYNDVRMYSGVHGYVLVYTLSTNSWTTKVGVDPPPYWVDGPQVFVNGAIHWVKSERKVDHTTGCQVMNSILVVFDVCKEAFSYIECPNEISHDYNAYSGRYPFVLDGLLGILCSYSIRLNHVWVMEEYGVPNSWTKRDKLYFNIEQPWCFKTNGELLYTSGESQVNLYDPDTELEFEVAKTSFCETSVYGIHCFVESLVLATRH